MKTSLIIPAHNEAEKIGKVIAQALGKVDEIIVVDDASDDKTGAIAEEAGARVIRNQEQQGYAKSVERGLAAGKHELLLTIDGDGEHDPEDIISFKELHRREKPSIIIGRRSLIPRKGERIVSTYFEERYGIGDVWCGMRLIEKSVLERILPFATNDDYGLTFIHDALRKGMSVINAPIRERARRTESRIGISNERERELMRKFIRILQVDNQSEGTT